VSIERSNVGREQLGDDIAWVWRVVIWALSNLGGDVALVWSVVICTVSKWGDIERLWNLVMWAVSNLVGYYSVGMECSDVASEIFGVAI